jgi:hypothetical protein
MYTQNPEFGFCYVPVDTAAVILFGFVIVTLFNSLNTLLG